MREARETRGSKEGSDEGARKKGVWEHVELKHLLCLRVEPNCRV